MSKTIIIGNGINISEFPNSEWSLFEKKVDNLFFKIIDGFNGENIYLRFYKDVVTAIKEQIEKNSLENKMIFFDLNALIDINPCKENINYAKHLTRYWLLNNLTGWKCKDCDSDRKIDSFFNEFYNSTRNTSKISWMFDELKNQNSIFLAYFQVTMYYKLLKTIYIYSIKEILFSEYNLINLKYTGERLKWLSSFESVITLNVDPVMKNSEPGFKVHYPHGYFDKKREVETNFEYVEKLAESQGIPKELKGDYMSFQKEIDIYNIHPNKVVFSFESKEKLQQTNILDYFTNNPNNPFTDGLIKELKKAGITKNKSTKNNVEGYHSISKIKSSIVLIYGVSINNDEAIFNLLRKNKKVKKIIIFCSEKEKTDFIKLFENKDLLFPKFSEWLHY